MKQKGQAPLVGLGLSRDYFSKNLIPSVPEIQELIYYSKSALIHSEGVELLYVKNGKGTFSVNGQFYPCQKGSAILLSFYHITRILPDNGHPMQLFRCRFTLNTFLYFLANPCCSQTSFGLTEKPTAIEFEYDEQEYIEILFSELKKELSCHSSFHDNISIYILMELIARIDRTE